MPIQSVITFKRRGDRQLTETLHKPVGILTYDMKNGPSHWDDSAAKSELEVEHLIPYVDTLKNSVGYTAPKVNSINYAMRMFGDPCYNEPG